MKALKLSTKYQLVRDGELSNAVYNTHREACQNGDYLIDAGFIHAYEVKPVNATWLTAKP